METGLLTLAACSIFFLALDLDAQTIHVRCPTNVVRGFEYFLDIEVRKAGTALDTNWYGTIDLSADEDTVFNEVPVDVVKGKGLFPVSMKIISGNTTLSLYASDNSGRAATFNGILPVFDPERIACPLLFTEIMYHTDNDKTDEWIEIFNPSDHTIDLGYKTLVVHDSLTISKSYCHTIKPGSRTIPPGQLQLQPGAYAVIVRDLDRFEQLYPEIRGKITASDPDYVRTIILEAPGKSDSFNMPNSEGTLFITDGTNATGSMIALLYYNASWGGENNISLERKSTGLPSSEKLNWSSSLFPGGTPGRPNTIATVSESPMRKKLDLSSDVWIRDGVPLTFRLKPDAPLKEASLIIVSSFGRKMATLLENASLENGKEYLFELSNRTAVGDRMPVGLYMVRFDGKREDGTRLTFYRNFVVGAR